MMRDAQTFEPHDGRLTRPSFWDWLGERWTSDLEETLVCCRIRQETHDVKSFFFMSREGRTFVFEPGQFITLELEIDGETINRCYTISSAPTRPHTISITVKRVPGGKISNWLHDHLRTGDCVRVLGPAGEFTCARQPAAKYLFLSAGSGITPLMSMSRAYHELGEDRDIVFVHSARTPDDIIFARELDLIAASQERFRTSFVCERIGERTNWTGVTGFLTLPLLRLIAPDYMDREVFTCGPAPYMDAVRGMLSQADFDMRRYHQESFTFETLALRSLALEAGAPGSSTDAKATSNASNASNASDSGSQSHVGGVRFAVTFARSRRDIECGAEQHVLDAARQAGVRLPASCTQGMCGTCKVKLVAGQVKMQHNGGIRQREIDQGMVLLCCSKPLTDLVIDK